MAYLTMLKNGTCRLEIETPTERQFMHFESLSDVVNYCNEHDVDVHIKDIRHE